MITLSGVARGQVGHAPGVQGLEAHQHTSFRHLKSEFFSTNFGQNTPKIRIFKKKGCKIAAAPGVRHRTPMASGGWRLRFQTPALLVALTDNDLSKGVSGVKTILLL